MGFVPLKYPDITVIISGLSVTAYTPWHKIAERYKKKTRFSPRFSPFFVGVGVRARSPHPHHALYRIAYGMYGVGM